ncbi:MAG: PVC-type heme-binding CxxCH protein, partial [Planctomyces sp.]
GDIHVTQRFSCLRQLASSAALIVLAIPALAAPPTAAPPRPLAASPVVTTETPGHIVPLQADIRGVRNLYLVVSDAGNGFGCDWADWAEPQLTGPAGTLKLTDLKWKSAQAEWGKPGVGVNAAGDPLRINGKPVAFGIGTHANSIIHFEIPEGYEKFTARVGIDNGGSDQNNGSSMQFFVYSEAPGPTATAATAAVDRSPAAAVAGIDRAEGLDMQLFAAEPMLLSPSNIDVDHLGRIWVCEVVNYRRFANGNNPDRPEGDRILVLEDTDADGKADRQTVFHQGRDIDSAHGVCVLGNRVIVSAGDSVFSFYDDNGDLQADRREVMFTGIKGTQHDHGIHSFTFGPDGRLYFNFGNRGVRINFVMEYGNYGYKDEFTGAGWQAPRANLETEIPQRHWHLNDPGVVPNLLQTGAGSPTGILIYEGDALPARYLNQLIHCDAGPNVVRSYAVAQAGAGYTAEINNIVNGARDQWFRPSDVCVAPDGSLIVADWYDPGVGGHRQGDVEKGRLFRVSMPGRKYTVPKADLTTVAGAVEALKSPNTATRYLAFMTLKAAGPEAQAALQQLYSDSNPRFRARAMWLLGQIAGLGPQTVENAVTDSLPDIRVAGLRLARRLGMDIVPVVYKLADDASPAVQRECLIALRSVPTAQRTAPLLAVIRRIDPHDRWLLEAAGIAAEGAWDELFTAWSAQDAARGQATAESEARWRLARQELSWRSRGSKSAADITGYLLANLTAKPVEQPAADPQLARWFRALDFQSRDAVDKAARTLLTAAAESNLPEPVSEWMAAEALQRVSGNPLQDPALAAQVRQLLDRSAGTPRFVQLVRRFAATDRYPELLTIAQQKPAEQIGVEAMTALLELKQWDLLSAALAAGDPAAVATAEAMGNTATGAMAEPLLAVIRNSELTIDVRRAAVRAAARVNNGALEIATLAEKKSLDSDLEQAAAAALHASPSRQARERAQQLFPLPPSRDNTPTPPISELAKMKGDAGNGRIVFFSTGTCHKCHVVDGMGREIGPNLTEIGSKLSREAMFESVLYPRAGISHNYEMWTAVLSSGTTVNGLLVSSTDAEVSLRGDDALVRKFPRTDIEELVKQKISLMPADLQKTMTSQELADVVEYLQGLKKKQVP